VLSTLLAAAGDFVRPRIDYHALAPELILAAGICVVLMVDLFVADSKRWITATVAGLFLIGSVIPVVTLALIGDNTRSMFGGRYVVDRFSLIMKAMFLIIGYVVVLLSTNEVEEGGYHQGEYYVLLLASVLGMVMMTSSRDLVSVFVAFEFLSIPTYMLAAWRKRDPKSNEAGVKYFLLGVFASAVMLYGMSLLYGVSSSTKLTDISAYLAVHKTTGVVALAIVFIIVGFGFKVSAVPFHSWAPDTYEGAPTPVTAFLSVASKAGGFIALVSMVYLCFPSAKDVWQPFIFVLAALTMTVGNVLALKQTNIVRMLAYSSVSQGGFILMPFVVAGTKAAETSLKTIVVYRGHAQDAQRGDQQYGRDAVLRARPDRVDDVFPRLAGRHSTIRRVVRQAERFPLRARGRHDARLHNRDHRCGQHRHRVRLLRQRDARDVDEAHPARRQCTAEDSAVGDCCARHHGRRHARPRYSAAARPSFRQPE